MALDSVFLIPAKVRPSPALPLYAYLNTPCIFINIKNHRLVNFCHVQPALTRISARSIRDFEYDLFLIA